MILYNDPLGALNYIWRWEWDAAISVSDSTVLTRKGHETLTFGNAYAAGQTFSTNFPTQNAYQGTHAADGGNPDAFVTKLNPAAPQKGIRRPHGPRGPRDRAR